MFCLNEHKEHLRLYKKELKHEIYILYSIVEWKQLINAVVIIICYELNTHKFRILQFFLGLRYDIFLACKHDIQIV